MTRDHMSRHDFKNQPGIIRGSAEDCSLTPPPTIRVAVNRLGDGETVFKGGWARFNYIHKLRTDLEKPSIKGEVNHRRINRIDNLH